MDRVNKHFHRDNKFPYEIYKSGEKHENAETMKNLPSIICYIQTLPSINCNIQNLPSINCCLSSPPPPAALNSAAPSPFQRKRLDFLGHILFLWKTFHHDSLH